MTTREEIIKYLFDKKCYLEDKWTEVKEILSNFGFVDIDETVDSKCAFLYISSGYMFRGDSKEQFYAEDIYREIPVNEILGFKEISKTSYRPFKNDNECWDEMKKHEPFGWVKNLNDEKYFINEVSNGIGTVESFHPYNEALCTVRFLDDTLFGIKVEPLEQNLQELKETSKNEDLSGYPTVDSKPGSLELFKQKLYELTENYSEKRKYKLTENYSEKRKYKLTENDQEELKEEEDLRTFQRSLEELLEQKPSIYNMGVKFGEFIVHSKAKNRLDIIDKIEDLMNILDDEICVNKEILEYLSKEYDKAYDD